MMVMFKFKTKYLKIKTEIQLLKLKTGILPNY